MSLASVTNDAKSYAEQDIPVPRETGNKKLQVGGFSVKSVNPFSKAALRGMDIVNNACAGNFVLGNCPIKGA